MSLPRARSPSSIDDPPAGAVKSRPPCAHRKLEWYGHPCVSFDQVRSSAASCGICQLYVDIVLVVVTGSLPSVFKGTRSEAEKKLILDRMNLLQPDASDSNRVLRFNIFENTIEIEMFREDESRFFTIDGRDFRPAFRIGQRTNSEKSFIRARKWLHECLTRHNCLRTSLKNIQSPKRLLDVRGSAEEPIRLVETQGDEYPYVCLSHRWGSPEQKRLISTTRTIQNHMTEIRWDDLPATFQDAVTICRRMAVNYCWIDSLCILQNKDGLTDDEAEATKLDFAQQNSEMARIYYNSHFTISADISTHMNSGIFSKSPIDEHRLDVIGNFGDSAAVYLRQRFSHYNEKIPDLETRGWTFQEFSLPRRMLHFGTFDIEWRCTNLHTCECGQLEYDGYLLPKWHRHHDLAEVARPVPSDLPRAVEWWGTIVQFYTKRELTNPSDKLPALSGLAQLRKEARGGVYLAGLWQDSLIHDLCWYNNLDPNYEAPRISGRFGRRPVDYRAPSWSWASLDTHSGCYYWRSEYSFDNWIDPWTEPRTVCTIFKSFCQSKTADETGEVQYGFLDVGVVLIPATVCLDRRPEIAWNITNVEADLKLDVFRPDCELANDGLSAGEQVYCAPIAGAVFKKSMHYGCLVLRKLYTSAYQRVGFCILRKGDDPSSFGIQCDGQLHELPSPSSSNRQDYAFLDADKSRIMII